MRYFSWGYALVKFRGTQRYLAIKSGAKTIQETMESSRGKFAGAWVSTMWTAIHPRWRRELRNGVLPFPLFRLYDVVSESCLR